VTEMRPDPDSDLAGEESEYGDDTGFAAEATRTTEAGGSEPDPEVTTAADTGGLTAEDDEPGNGAD
jgi:hypothetical protein